jgi:hypothetical protein
VIKNSPKSASSGPLRDPRIYVDESWQLHARSGILVNHLETLDTASIRDVQMALYAVVELRSRLKLKFQPRVCFGKYEDRPTELGNVQGHSSRLHDLVADGTQLGSHLALDCGNSSPLALVKGFELGVEVLAQVSVRG